MTAQHLDSVNQLANLSDAELIATSPSLQNVTHQMEMDRRLTVAIVELTDETIADRNSADRTARRIVWLTIVLVVLIVALVGPDGGPCPQELSTEPGGCGPRSASETNPGPISTQNR